VSSKVWVALLRGINLGPHKKVAMSDLRALLESLGYDDVRTHLQSGNALFTTAKGTARELERNIASRLAADCGFDVKVLVRSAAELSTVVSKNPFVKRKVDPKQLHAVFLSSTVPAKKIRAVDPASYAPDEVEFANRVIYVRLPNGVQGAKMPNWEKILGVGATMRTWRTVTRLSELATPRPSEP
jgi:uncharacterized protein (DUF1697 family)